MNHDVENVQINHPNNHALPIKTPSHNIVALPPKNIQLTSKRHYTSTNHKITINQRIPSPGTRTQTQIAAKKFQIFVTQKSKYPDENLAYILEGNYERNLNEIKIKPEIKKLIRLTLPDGRKFQT